ncbi:MAG: 2-iminoacetate synthase ThiH [Acidobacteria bacterium]|nr:2-iminoacetate synthase ThiH [Acidobacteriota bacterium]
MKSFGQVFARRDWGETRNRIASQRTRDVERALASSRRSDTLDMGAFLALISPAAEPFLGEIVNESRARTRRRFGNVIQLYAPLYLSNECRNICTYCGFSADVRRPRLTLDEAGLTKEVDALASEGFAHLLLVSGEAPREVGIDYFLRCIPVVRQRMSQLSMEVQPLSEEEYVRLGDAGVSAVLVYQESYDEAGYARFHPKGKKADFAYRLDTADRLGRAEIKKIGLGALLGLSDWRTDAFMLASHLDYLRTTYWRTHYSVSFPRLRPAEGGFAPPARVSDKALVQMIAAFRLFDASVDLVLSTREPASLRDRLIPIGVTTMSAGSKTEPGGYASPGSDALQQFEISDDRPPPEIASVLRRAGLNPVWKDWDAVFDA